MDRRTFVRTLGGGIAGTGVAGCLTRDNDDNGPEPDDEGVLTIATYASFVERNPIAVDDNDNGDESDENEDDTYDSPAAWLEEAFLEEHSDAEIDWVVPDAGLELYVQQSRQETGVDPDLYLGLTIADLVSVDRQLETQLFESINYDALENVDRIRDDIDFTDPYDRVIPYNTGYVTPVYDESAVDEPEAFEDLLETEYEYSVIVQDGRSSNPGQAFLLWTIHEYGEEYLDYWQALAEQGLEITDTWSESYFGPYAERQRSVVVSYSTDQVFHIDENEFDGDQNRVAFLDGRAYENHEGVAVFEDALNNELAYDFVDFVLTNEAQAAIAEKNVQFPAVEAEYVDLPERFDVNAREPEEAVSFTYDELEGSLEEWNDDWAETIESTVSDQ